VAVLGAAGVGEVDACRLAGADAIADGVGDPVGEWVRRECADDLDPAWATSRKLHAAGPTTKSATAASASTADNVRRRPTKTRVSRPFRPPPAVPERGTLPPV
jgi:hypothetical protein